MRRERATLEDLSAKRVSLEPTLEDLCVKNQPALEDL